MYPTPEEWRKAFESLPENVKETIFQKSLTACPECGTRAVPLSWAVTAIEAATGMRLVP